MNQGDREMDGATDRQSLNAMMEYGSEENYAAIYRARTASIDWRRRHPQVDPADATDHWEAVVDAVLKGLWP